MNQSGPTTMSSISSGKVIYTARTHTTGGRENGVSRSSDGQLDIKLSSPGSSRPGTNPEQLFAAGWSACFEGPLGVVARGKRLDLPSDLAIDAEVDLLAKGGEYALRARLSISMPGMERSVAQELVEAAAKVCPYSKATSGNIDVAYNVI